MATERDIIFNTKVNTGTTAQDIDNISQSLSQGKDASKKFGTELDALKKRSADLTKQLKSLDAGSEFDKLYDELTSVNKAIKATEAGATDLNARFDDIYGDIQPLTGRIGELEDRLYEMALAGEKDTDMYRELQGEISRFKQTILEVDKEIDSLTGKGKNLQAALQLGETVVASYGAIQGLAALAGSDNEALTETLVKLEAVQVTLASVEQVRLALESESLIMQKARVLWSNIQAVATGKLTLAQIAQNGATAAYTAVTTVATGAMAALNVVMNLNPVFLLVTGFAAIAGAIALFSMESDHAAEDNEKFNDSLERSNELLELNNEKLVRAANNRLKSAQAAGASEEVLLQKQLAVLKAEEEARERNAKELERQVGERLKILRQAIKEQDSDTQDATVDELNKLKSKYRQIRALDGQYEIDRKNMLTEFNRKQSEDRKKDAEEEAQQVEEASKEAAQKAKERRDARLQREKEAAQKRLELERNITDLTIANIQDEDTRQRMALAEKHRRELEDLKKQYGERADLISTLTTQQSYEQRILEQKIQAEVSAETKAAQDAQAAQDIESKKAALEAKLIEARDDFQAEQALRIELAQMERDQAIADKNATEGEKYKATAEYDQKIADLDKARADREQVTNEAIAQSRQSLALSLSGAFNQIAALTREGSAAQKAAALTDIAINTAVGFVNGLRIAQQTAIAAGPGAALAFPIFLATQVGAVLSAANKAREILKGGPSVSAPSSGGSSGSAPAPVQNALTGNNTTNTTIIPGAASVLVVDSFKKVDQQQTATQAVATFPG